MLFLEKLEQKRFYLIAVIILCMLIGGIYGLKFADKESLSSTSVMLVKKANSQDTSLLNDGTLELSKNLVSTYEELIKSDSNLDSIKNKLNIDTHNNLLKEKISVNKVSNSDTFKIQVRNRDAELALNISREILDNFSDDLKNVNSFTKIYIIDNPHIIGTTSRNIVLSYLIQSAILGLMIDVLYIIFLIQLDKNAKTGFDLETDVSLKTLMTIPYKEMSKKNQKENKLELIAYESEKTDFSKAFKNLRANIQFVNVNNDNKNIILITSPNRNDGKSYVAANLAISYAEVGKKVILIDADMRGGRQGKLFNIPNNLGLSNFLSNLDTNGVEINELVNKFINETAIKNLNLITSGTVPPNSNELLTSTKLVDMIKDLSVFYDVIIIDGTPILTTTDSLILTRVVSSTVIVANYKNTKTEDLIRAKKDVQNVGGRIIGVVLNNVKNRKIKDAKKSIKNNIDKFKGLLKEKVEKIKKYLQDKTYEQKLLNETNDVNTEMKEELKEETYIEKIDDKIDEKVEEFEDKVEDTFESIQEKIKGIAQKITNKFSNKDNEDYEKIEIEEKVVEEKNEDVRENIENKINENNVQVIEELKEDNKGFNFSDFANRYKQRASQFVSNGKEQAIDTFDKTKSFFTDRFKVNSKEEVKDEIVEEVKENIENEEKQEVIEEVVEKPRKSRKKRADSENEVLVLVDSENGFCRVFSRHCFTEKLVRGIDKTDGIYKGNYSVALIKARTNYIMENYDITSKQVKNIDPLVFATLHDYDECMWLEKKKTSNKAEIYVRCMTEKIEKEPHESHVEYVVRCQEMRKAALLDADIELEYKVDDIYSSRKMNFTDKLIMKKYADIYDNKKLVDKLINEGDKDSIVDRIKEYTIDKVEDVKEFFGNLKVEQVKAKSIEELENEIAEDKKEIDGQYKIDDLEQEKMSDEEFSKNLKEEYERQKEERKQEAEVLKKIKKEKQEFKKREKIEAKKIKQEAKRFKREELRKNKILEKEKQRVEARIEEELLDDNLYPKTKHNKNL